MLPLLLLLSQNPRGSVEDERGSSSRLPDAEGHVCGSEGRRERQQHGGLDYLADDKRRRSAYRGQRLVAVSSTGAQMTRRHHGSCKQEDTEKREMERAESGEAVVVARDMCPCV